MELEGQLPSMYRHTDKTTDKHTSTRTTAAAEDGVHML